MITRYYVFRVAVKKERLLNANVHTDDPWRQTIIRGITFNIYAYKYTCMYIIFIYVVWFRFCPCKRKWSQIDRRQTFSLWCDQDSNQGVWGTYSPTDWHKLTELRHREWFGIELSELRGCKCKPRNVPIILLLSPVSLVTTSLVILNVSNASYVIVIFVLVLMT